MSTNYYAYKKIPEYKRREIIDDILSREVKDSLSNPDVTYREIEHIMTSLADTIPERLNEYKDCVHLGKSAVGWQFLWQLHPGQYYEPLLSSIKEFLADTEHWQIVDEYDVHFTPDEFFDKIGSIIFKGENATDSFDYNKTKRGYKTTINSFNEFSTEEGLRFSTDEFS